MREPHLSHTSRCRVGVLVLVSLGKSVPMSSSPCLSRSRRAAPPAWPNSRDLAPSLRQLPHADLVSAGHRTGTSPSTTQTCGLPTLRLPLKRYVKRIGPPSDASGRGSAARRGATGGYDASMAGLSKDAELERLVLSGGPLRIDEVVAVARGRVPVELSDEGRKRMSAAREVVERAVAEGRRVYGVSTGFGLLANTPIAPSDLRELQRRIVLSHATG